MLLCLPRTWPEHLLKQIALDEPAGEPLLPPVDPMHEVWAAGVTYRKSREARRAESADRSAYEKVYEAERPELFLKATGTRAVGHGMAIHLRRDSGWTVPEPELVLVLDRQMEIVGYTAGNDVSSRDIEGENPLYLPQAKIYDGACSLGPGIVLCRAEEMRDFSIRLVVEREESRVFEDETSTSVMHRSFKELVEYLGQELSFPCGCLLMTGTGIVPPNDFGLQLGDRVVVQVGELELVNYVE